jgi:hypothetical protein
VSNSKAGWDFFGTAYGRAGVWSYVILWIRIAFGAHSLLSGINYFHPLIGLPALVVSPAGMFIAEMDNVGLYALIKLVEIAVGVMLLANRWVPLALAIELPTTVSIFYLNTFVDAAPRQLFTGPRELFMNGVLILAYWPYYRSLLVSKAVYAPVWRKGIGPGGADPLTGEIEGRVLP